MNVPALRKEIVVAHAGTNFVNGDQEFDLTVEDMDEMIRNFTEHPRQVPVLFGGDHALGPERADIPASGWVEGLRRAGTDLVARVKFIGEAAAAIAMDAFRGVSIGAYQPPDLHGNQVGWRLDHLLITNAPFFSDLNIAARHARGGSSQLLYLTEAKMADKKEVKPDTPAPKAELKTAPKPEDMNPAERIEALECLLQEKEKAIRDLFDANENLTEELKLRQQDGDLEMALKENRKLQRRLDATKIRELVALGCDRGQFKRDSVKGYDGGDDRSDEITLAWFKNSIFGGDMGKLTFALKTFPKTAMRRSFVSGDPGDEEAAELKAEDKEVLETLGKDVAEFAATRKARNFTEFKKAKAAVQKG